MIAVPAAAETTETGQDCLYTIQLADETRRNYSTPEELLAYQTASGLEVKRTAGYDNMAPRYVPHEFYLQSIIDVFDEGGLLIGERYRYVCKLCGEYYYSTHLYED